MKKYLLYIVGLCVFWSCDPVTNNNCSQLYTCHSSLDPIYYFEDHSNQYYSPAFNPNNANEIMYLKMHIDSTGHDSVSLEKFNYVTTAHSVIISSASMMSSNLDFWKYNWSQTGWIALENDANLQIYKIRDDGTMLQQLTTDGSSFYPIFNYAGDKLFFTNNSATYGKSLGILMDISTNSFLDTSDIFGGTIGSFGLGTGLSPNSFLFSILDTIKQLDESLNLNNTFKPVSGIANFNEFNYLRNIGSNANEIVFISNFNGMFRLDLTTHTAYLIKAGCTDRFVTSPTVSPDGNKIAYVQYIDENTEANPCFIKRRIEIHIMNIDGSNDQVLNLP